MESVASSEGGRLRYFGKVILIPALAAMLTGYLISYAFPARYTSQSLVRVEAQTIPEAFVPPIFKDLPQYITGLHQRVISQARLRPMVERMGLVKNGKNTDDVVANIQFNMQIQPVVINLSDIGAGSKLVEGSNSVPSFYIRFTGSTAREAQEVCTDLTSMLLEEDLRSREDVLKGTTDFLTKQFEDARQNLNDMDTRLAAFKNQHMGQLPGDKDDNMKILGGLNAQLDANTQNLNRAIKDKDYTESLLAQQLAAWKTSRSPTANMTDSATDPESVSETTEIRRFRLQIHQYQELMAMATQDQKKIQQEIGVYQSRVVSSPAIEMQYRELARDYDNVQRVYQDDLSKVSTWKMATQAERAQLGERMSLLDPATLPESPDFPNRPLFASAGLGVGLVFGIGLSVRLRYRPMLQSRTAPSRGGKVAPPPILDDAASSISL